LTERLEPWTRFDAQRYLQGFVLRSQEWIVQLLGTNSRRTLHTEMTDRKRVSATRQWCNQDFFQYQDQDQDLIFKTKTKTLKFFQVQDQAYSVQDQDLTLHLKTKTKTFLWRILEADRKAFFIFGRKRKCQRKWNSIYGWKRNENKNGHSFSAKNESHLVILVFFFFFIHSDNKSALQCAANTSSSFAFFAGGPCWRDSTLLIYSV